MTYALFAHHVKIARGTEHLSSFCDRRCRISVILLTHLLVISLSLSLFLSPARPTRMLSLTMNIAMYCKIVRHPNGVHKYQICSAHLITGCVTKLAAENNLLGIMR